MHDSENGFSFDPQDAPALTTLLLQMEKRTQTERARMGQRSTEIIANYTPQGFGEAIASLLPPAAR